MTLISAYIELFIWGKSPGRRNVWIPYKYVNRISLRLVLIISVADETNSDVESREVHLLPQSPVLPECCHSCRCHRDGCCTAERHWSPPAALGLRKHWKLQYRLVFGKSVCYRVRSWHRRVGKLFSSPVQ